MKSFYAFSDDEIKKRDFKIKLIVCNIIRMRFDINLSVKFNNDKKNVNIALFIFILIDDSLDSCNYSLCSKTCY